MSESEILIPTSNAVDYSSSYSMPEVYITSSSAVLYRVRKAGKYFIIKTPKENSGQAQALLKREYEMSLGKSHPNIVNVFTFESSTPVGSGIVMEYIDGRTLNEFIAENPSLAVRNRVFVQLLQAVSYIHRCGVVHNDIKPENIIITRSDNDVKLIDFGLADNDAYYLTHTLGCTRAYASPELLARDKDIDARSDIYSLGMIMQELFGSRYSRITKRCLYKEKQKRYNNADELLAAVRHYHRPLAVVLSIVFAIIISLPLLYIGRTIVMQNEQAKAELRLFESIEHEVENIYSVTADSLAHATYYEFACNNILSFWERLSVYNDKEISTITSSDLYTKATAYYAKKVADCSDKLWSIAKTLPLYSMQGFSREEFLYYNNLIAKRKPYSPYNK